MIMLQLVSPVLENIGVMFWRKYLTDTDSQTQTHEYSAHKSNRDDIIRYVGEIKNLQQIISLGCNKINKPQAKIINYQPEKRKKPEFLYKHKIYELEQLSHKQR